MGGTQKQRNSHMSDTDKMKMAITQLNLFGDDKNEDQELLEQLKAQNMGLQERIKKLQKDKERLKKDMVQHIEGNKELNETKKELEELQESMKLIQDENEKQDKLLAAKDREIAKLNQSILKNKHKFEKEKNHITKEYKDKIMKIEQKYSTKTSLETLQNDGDDEDINEIIEECGDDLNKLKNKLYEVMEIMKNVDAENEELKEEINALNKKHNEKLDELMSDYGAVRDQLSSKIDTNKNRKKHQRKRSSKILRKMARFEKWMEDDVALPQYIQHFHDNDYDRIDVVRTLKESDLKKIGISKVGHRRLIMEKIQDINEKKEALNLNLYSVSENTPDPSPEPIQNHESDEKEQQKQQEKEEDEEEDT